MTIKSQGLRWYQKEAVDACFQALKKEEKDTVISAPTGSGKSHIIAELCHRAIQNWDCHIMVIAHRKELLQQNAGKIVASGNGYKVGIYSAGLKEKDVSSRIICAGIQSVHKRAHEFGKRNFVIVDEAHLIPTKSIGLYRKFLSELRHHQRVRMAGLTATPYRTGEGSLYGTQDEQLFGSMCYEVPLKRLIDEGYLSNVVSSPVETEWDTSQLKLRNGDFVTRQMQDLFDDNDKTAKACSEIIKSCVDRKSVLIFAASLQSADVIDYHISGATGERVEVITGDTPQLFRAQWLEDFKSRKLKWLINVDVLTTGFDAPCIDAIAIVRSTASAGLFAQMCGRGFRVYPGKLNFLLMDFGQNLLRHGPIDAIDYGKPKGKGEPGDAPFKECPKCGNKVGTSVRVCENCGYKFPTTDKHEEESDKLSPLLSNPVMNPVMHEIIDTTYQRHNGKAGKLDTVRVDYVVDGDTGWSVSEWVCPEHEGYARTKFVSWWCARCLDSVIPNSIDEVLAAAQVGKLAGATRVIAKRQGKFNKIVSVNLKEKPPPKEWKTMAEIELEEELDF